MKTKTLFVILGFILFSGSTSIAQNFKFGLLAGFVVANSHLINKPSSISSSDIRVYYPMLSFNVNGYLGYKSNRFLGLSVEPGYIQKGGMINDGSTRIQLNYIQIPILANLYISDKIWLSIGPELGYLINAKAKTKDNLSNLIDRNNGDLELSGLIGINYNLIEKMDIGLRYNHGLSYTTQITFTDDIGTPVKEANEYNQYFQLILRLKI